MYTNILKKITLLSAAPGALDSPPRLADFTDMENSDEDQCHSVQNSSPFAISTKFTVSYSAVGKITQSKKEIINSLLSRGHCLRESAGFKSNGSKPSSDSFWGIPEHMCAQHMCQNILRNECVKSANTNVIIALASTVSIIKTTIAKYSNLNSKLGLPSLSCHWSVSSTILQIVQCE